MAGQFAFALGEQEVVPAAVWETLPPEIQEQVVCRLAQLIAQLVEVTRDE